MATRGASSPQPQLVDLSRLGEGLQRLCQFQTTRRGRERPDGPRRLDLAGERPGSELPSAPEFRRIVASRRIDHDASIAARADRSLDNSRTERLVTPQLSVRTAAKAVGKGSADINPEFPATHRAVASRPAGPDVSARSPELCFAPRELRANFFHPARTAGNTCGSKSDRRRLPACFGSLRPRDICRAV